MSRLTLVGYTPHRAVLKIADSSDYPLILEFKEDGTLRRYWHVSGNHGLVLDREGRIVEDDSAQA